MSWNCGGILYGTHDLDLVNLVVINNVDVVALSETELPASAAEFAIADFTSFYPIVNPGAKTRVLLLIRTKIAACCNAKLATSLMDDSLPSVWVQLEAHGADRDGGGGHQPASGALLLGAVYRKWGSPEEERDEFETLISQIDRVGDQRRIVFAGDLNVDMERCLTPGTGTRPCWRPSGTQQPGPGSSTWPRHPRGDPTDCTATEESRWHIATPRSTTFT
jgi:hypothetical protein